MNDYVFIFEAKGDLRVFRSLADACAWAQADGLIARGYTGAFLADGSVLLPRTEAERDVLVQSGKVALDSLVYRLSEYQRRLPSLPAAVDPAAYAERWLDLHRD